MAAGPFTCVVSVTKHGSTRHTASHPASSALTVWPQGILELFADPPVGFLDISITNLHDLEDDIWPTQHADCYEFDADPAPSAREQ